jgi:hypothetical protein
MDIDKHGWEKTISEICVKFVSIVSIRGRKLLHQIRRDDLDAGQRHLGDGPVARMRGCGGDLFQHVVTLDELAKRGVLPVKKARVAMANEELTAGGIRILRAGHREDAADMGFVVKLGLDLVAGTASAPSLLLAGVLGQRITTLDHETLDDAMETSAVVKALERQFLEIFDMAGRDVRPEFKDHFAGSSGKNGNFTHNLWVGIIWLCRRERWSQI